VPAVGRAYVTTASPEAVTAHQTAGMPTDAAKAVQALIAEYEDNQTPEAHLAHDADKIEMLIQAIEYEALGADTRQWQDNALAALRTDAGAELARAVTSSSPQWWAASTPPTPNSAPAPALTSSRSKALPTDPAQGGAKLGADVVGSGLGKPTLAS
jgi:hypothetical protein